MLEITFKTPAPIIEISSWKSNDEKNILQLQSIEIVGKLESSTLEYI